jgi:hypothetical protein
MKYTLLKNKETGERGIRLTGGEIVSESNEPDRYAELRKRALRNRRRADIDDAYRSCGMTKVRGDSGRVYWE